MTHRRNGHHPHAPGAALLTRITRAAETSEGGPLPLESIAPARRKIAHSRHRRPERKPAQNHLALWVGVGVSIAAGLALAGWQLYRTNWLSKSKISDLWD